MTFKIIINLFLFISFQSFVHGKTYTRNELIKELIERHNLTEEHAAKVSCVAELSGFETDRINNHVERLESELRDNSLHLEYASFKPNYGIFLISSEFWCSETGVGGFCNVNCKDFLDDDINDDVECFKKIVPDFNNSNWPDWIKPWLFLFAGGHFRASCQWFKHIVNYFTNVEEKASDWKSLDDCMSKYPTFNYYHLDILATSGTRVFNHEFPHAAAIGWSNLENKTIDWKCGGSLISEDTILTAAHCLKFKGIGVPDVVRLGDLNLESDDDEKGAQQFEVLFVYIHPEYRSKFNDIALIKLKTKVEVTKFVIPACLWDRHLPREIKLEACGYGQTKYRGPYSPFLIKVSLSEISMEECDDHYYGSEKVLKNGLSENAHLCADDKSGKRMDTCKGDSGGPLEMKLHYKGRLVPFIVGVTSFGDNCGAGKPGVYARVSSFIDWIKQHVPELEVNGIKCSQKYEKLRFQEPVPVPRIHDYKVFEPEKLVFGDQSEQNTTATIISEQFLITAASNLKKILNPKRVHITANSTDILIEKVVYHPEYVQGKPENDLALIKLKSRIRWEYMDHPACVTQKDVYVDYKKISNIGSLSQLEKYYWRNELKEKEITYSKISNCLARNGSNDLNTEKLTCFKKRESTSTYFKGRASIYYVPDYCNVPGGTVITTTIIEYFLEEEHKRVIQGLVIQSHDCSFTLATDITKHYDWINSVVFGSETDYN